MYFRYDVIADNGYSFTDYMSGFWSSTINDNGMPANNPLWFMRDLMVVTLMAPAINYLVKGRYGLLSIILLAACYAINVRIPVCGMSMEAILFFSVGAYLAIHEVDITSIPKHLGVMMLLLYIPVQLFMNGLSSDCEYIHCFDLLTSFVKITAVFYLVSLLFKKKILKPTPRLSKISFLLYALHGIVINPVIMLLYKLSGCTDNPLALLGIYVTTPIIMVAVTQFLYATMTKFTPGIAKAVTGNRG
jgi:peptidoglycan/LPS O-acetylase OafA/YrhL